MLKILLLLTMALSGVSQDKAHHTEKGFKNPWLERQNGFGEFLRWQWNRVKKQWPHKIDYPKPEPFNFELSLNSETQIFFIHHATFLIRLPGLNIITDPVFSNRASPVSFLGPKRVHDLAIEISDLPKIDVILISHNHYDHLDLESIKSINQRDKPLIMAPLKNMELIRSIGKVSGIELDWWEDHQVSGYQIVLTPAQHWSARGMFDRNKTLWGGYAIKDKKSHLVYFAGDTGYAPLFTEIKERLGSPQVSLLPIGASEPRWFMKDHHMNAEDAIQAAKDLETKFSIAAHWGSFDLSDEAPDDPKRMLEDLLKHEVNQAIKFEALLPGQNRSYSW